MLPSFYLEQRNKKTESGKIRVSVLIFSIIMLFGIVYLWQMNVLVSQDYTMRDLKKELKFLEEENKKLQAAVAQSQSLPKLQEATQNLNLLSVGSVTYLETANEKMAVNQINGQQ